MVIMIIIIFMLKIFIVIRPMFVFFTIVNIIIVVINDVDAVIDSSSLYVI